MRLDLRQNGDTREDGLAHSFPRVSELAQSLRQYVPDTLRNDFDRIVGGMADNGSSDDRSEDQYSDLVGLFFRFDPQQGWHLEQSLPEKAKPYLSQLQSLLCFDAKAKASRCVQQSLESYPALVALLNQDDVEGCLPQLEKQVRQLCESSPLAVRTLLAAMMGLLPASNRR